MASGGIVGKGVAVLPDVHEIFNGLYGLKGDVGKVGRALTHAVSRGALLLDPRPGRNAQMLAP